MSQLGQEYNEPQITHTEEKNTQNTHPALETIQAESQAD